MRLSKKINENNKGFTLIELIVTVVILALVTAPFLSSFISASKTNVKSKRVQEANELSQYVIEQFKASSVDKLIDTYKLSDEEYIIDNANAMYNKKTKKYTGSLSKETSTGALPAGFSDNYSAEITLVPEKIAVNANASIPVIDKLDKESCAVFVKNLTQYDTLVAAFSRKIEVTIKKDPASVTKPYSVTLKVILLDSSLNELFSRETTWNYANVPDVYMLYSTMSATDKIQIINQLKCSEAVDVITGEAKPVNVYFIEQYDNPVTRMSQMNIGIGEYKNAALTSFTTKTLKDLADVTESTGNLVNTVIYTNVGQQFVENGYNGSSNTTDRGNTVNDAVKMIKYDTMYNLDVVVKYKDKKVSEYSASKTVGVN